MDALEIAELIRDEWELTTPELGTEDKDMFIAIDEFNTGKPMYQLVVINRPARSQFMCPVVNKVIQDIQIDLHQKLISVRFTDINNARTVFSAIKEEIVRILNANRFDSLNTLGATTINIINWIDAKLPHGFGTDKEPLYLTSRLSVSFVYYRFDY
jgi:hypothetical protein